MKRTSGEFEPSDPGTSSQSDGAGRFVKQTTRFGAWLSLSWERFWPLIVPTVLILQVFAIASWFGIWKVINAPVHVILLIAFAAMLAVTLYLLRHFVFPSSADVERRIERASQLEHRPLMAQSDALELGEDDSMSGFLWETHKKRMAERLKDMHGGEVAASGARFDRFSLRYYLPIALFLAFMFSFGTGGGAIGDVTRIGEDPRQLLSRFDIWVNPPTYTKKSPVYLSTKNDTNDARSILVPQHSELVAQFAGETETQISLIFNDGENSAPIEKAKDEDGESGVVSGERFSQELTKSGVVSLLVGGEILTSWSVKIVPDEKPRIFFKEEPRASLAGSLELSYGVEDDYGVVSAQGRVKPAARDENDKDDLGPAFFTPGPNARSLIEHPKFRLPLPRNRAKTGETKTNRDLSKHPLAGSLVDLTLHAKDDTGQEGTSETKRITLPGRSFSNPVSRALVEQRRILAIDANQRHHVANMLDALNTAPEKFIDDYTAHIAMRITHRRLVDARNDDQLRDVVDLMWDIALGIEFGRMSDAERRLREAQERLSEALERGAGDEEIDKLMKELRQAMNELMQALAEQARKNPQSNNPLNQNQNSQILRQHDLQRMMDQIENLAKSGSRDAARQLLSEMQRMMDNLRAGRHMNQRQAEGNEMNQALDKLGRLMQRQQELMNETFRMQRQQPRDFDPDTMNRQRQQQGQQRGQQQQGQQQGQQGQRQQGQQGQEGEMTAQEYADALKNLREQQRALQEELQALNEQLQSMGVDPSKEFGEAEGKMGEAGEGLGQGKPGEASRNQGQALEALRRGAQTMMQQMAGDRQRGGQQQGMGDGQRGQRMSRDPLGRSRGDNGSDFGEDTKLPGEIDAQTARRILEEIRRRMSNPLQPLIERDYLERLLKNR